MLSPQMFIGRTEELGGIYRQNLSTGCKTLLNIYKHAKYCFNTDECGLNALDLIPWLSTCISRERHIYWRGYRGYLFERKEKADFMYLGKRYSLNAGYMISKREEGE